MQIFVDECAQSGFLQMNLHHNLVEFLLFLLSPLGNLQKVTPNLEVFLSKLENEIFKMDFDNLKHSNTSKEEWQAISALAEDRTIVIKRADKGCV